MGGSGKNQTPSPEVTQGMLANQSALVKIAQQEAQQGQQLYSLTEPGLQTAETEYEALASGDPGAVLRFTSPATQQVSQATSAAKENILRTTPPGGEKNLALENADVAQGSQVGRIAAGAVTGAPNALASLAGQGISQSISAAGTGVGAYSAGTSALSSLGNMQLEEQQIQAQQKGGLLGSLTSLAQSGMEVGTMLALA